jgi:hypothetical protein
MSVGQAQAFAGFLISLTLFFFILIRRRQIWHRDIELIPMAFIAGSEIPPALILCAYAFHPDPAGALTKLAHLEVYISAGGLILLLSSLATVTALFMKVVAPLSAARKSSAASDNSEEDIHPNP